MRLQNNIQLKSAARVKPRSAFFIYRNMEFRQIGKSGLQVPALCYGTGTFGGRGEIFSAWGSTEVDEARRLLDICLEAGVNFFDTADAYSSGRSEEILGEAVKGRRDRVLIATKVFFPTGTDPNQGGTSRHHLIAGCEASLRRLGTDYIDLYQLHAFDALSPVEETLRALDDLIRAGKIRYIGASNFSGWHLMKSLSASERYGWSRYISHQIYYSLVGREYEWELMPLGLDQGVGALIWSPLGWARLTGKIRRNQPPPAVSRLPGSAQYGPPVNDELLYNVVDVLDEIAKETGKTIPQVALNWLLQRPTVSSVIIGARNEEQLRDNLGAAGWKLTAEQIQKLDAVSQTTPVYPYWHQRQTAADRNPPPVPEIAVTAESAGAAKA
jgi:aryl-alcohol dehydrogenase-like predicted oxidoreductase